MATLRELKGRIGSVASSEKITGAMKMISSAKMHKAESVLRRLLPYRECVHTIIGSLLNSDAPVSSPLTISHPTISNVAIVVIGSDDGLCGAYNANIFKGLVNQIAELRTTYGKNLSINIFAIGRKIIKAVDKYARLTPHVTLVTDLGLDSKSCGDSIKEFGADLTKRFLNGEFDRVDLMYMKYHSVSKQRLTFEAFLPVSAEDFGTKENIGVEPYLFEPDASTIFNTVLPMHLLSQMQEAFAMNSASEQAARVMAMQSANDNAKKLLETLQLEYNKLRQQSITTELLDIVGGQARD